MTLYILVATVTTVFVKSIIIAWRTQSFLMFAYIVGALTANQLIGVGLGIPGALAALLTLLTSVISVIKKYCHGTRPQGIAYNNNYYNAIVANRPRMPGQSWNFTP